MSSNEIDINSLEAAERQRWFQLIEFHFQRRQIQMGLAESINMNKKTGLIEREKQLLQHRSKPFFKLKTA